MLVLRQSKFILANTRAGADVLSPPTPVRKPDQLISWCSPHPQCTLYADPGDYSGSAETKLILANTRDLKQNTNYYKAHCGNAFVDTLMGKRIAVITTGG